jgi:hypothetical protein
MRHIILSLSLLGLAVFLFSCGGGAVAGLNDDSPTGAYKRLYAAVKSKDTEAIKAVMTKKSLDLAQMASARNNKPIEQELENGFTASTFSPNLPQIRDQRINGDMGAVEVYNSKDHIWEDLPFIREDGAWKLAVGDLFAGTFKSPGKGQAELEKEAANAAAGNGMIPYNVNTNSNVNVIKPIVPKRETNAK